VAAVIETILNMVKNLEDDALAQVPRLPFLPAPLREEPSPSPINIEESDNDKIPCEFCEK
jgi:hypothetical protein